MTRSPIELSWTARKKKMVALTKGLTQTTRVVLMSLELLQGHHLQRDIQVPVCQYGAGAQLIRQESSDDSYSLESECANFAKFRLQTPFFSQNHSILPQPRLFKSLLSLRSFCLLWGGWVVVEETSPTWWIWTHFSFRLFLNSWKLYLMKICSC